MTNLAKTVVSEEVEAAAAAGPARSPVPICVKSVSKTFGQNVRAVDDVSLLIEPGEFMVLVGPSGCGKTTLLRLIAGLEEVTAGRIYIGDSDVTNVRARLRDIAMVFQNYALYPQMTVRRNLGYGLKVRGVEKREIARRVDEVSALLGLEALLDRQPAALSGGQKQRVAMGRAIVREPQAFLMDEPLSNLDAKLRSAMRVELARLHERLGVTTVYVTHDQTEAMTLGQRVAVMKDGVIQQVGRPHELYRRPTNMFVAAFIGSPAMNLFHAVLVRGVLSAGSFRSPVPSDLEGSVSSSETKVVVGIRPEHFKDPELNPGLPSVEGRVAVFEDLGADAHAVVELDVEPVEAGLESGSTGREAGEETVLLRSSGALVIARVNPRAPCRRGESIKLSWDTDDLYVFDPESGASLRRREAR